MRSTFGFWYIQRYWKINTKKMVGWCFGVLFHAILCEDGMLIIHVGLSQFVITNVATIFIPLWGMIGIWTTKIGCVRCTGLTFEF